ncbi:MAG: fibronectin type III domain-containing protein [Candidatus Bipolaricaulaceae bacterium]
MRRRWAALLGIALGAALAGCNLGAPLPPPPAAPRGLTASLGTHPDRIVLTWEAVEGAATYEVQRAERPDEGAYRTVGTVAIPSFADPVGRENEGKWFWYRVRACNAAGCSPWTGEVRGYAGRPPEPTNVQASDGSYLDRIVITWDPVPGATYYQIFRDPGADPTCRGDLCFLAMADTNMYEDLVVRAGLRYRYAVRACNGYGCSAPSATDTGCVEPCPLLFSADAE